MTGINSINEVSRTCVQEADAIQDSSARKAVEDAPDVREEKIAEIRQRLQDGTYAVSSQVLARKLLNQQPQP